MNSHDEQKTVEFDSSSMQVQSAPEKSKYIRQSAWQEYVAQPFLRRAAWLISCGLSVLSIGPLIVKGFVNVVDSMFDSRSMYEAGKNFANALIAMPILAGVSAISVIFPDAGRAVVRLLVLPARLAFKITTDLPSDKAIIREEIEKKVRAIETKAFIKISLPWQESKLETISLAPTRILKDVVGKDGVAIDAADILFDSKSDDEIPWRIRFGAAAGFYQTDYDDIVFENEQLRHHTRAFNYPGITNADSIESMKDCVNAGIAQVYDLAKTHHWNNAQIEQNLHLYGYCLGGAIALQVALYFKKKFNLDLFVFVDRSFASLNSVAAGLIKYTSGLPLWYAKILSNVTLCGAGGFNIDSVAAVKKLNPQKVVYLNLGQPYLPLPDSTKHYLGIGPPRACVDIILQNNSSLLDGLSEAKLQCGVTTKTFFKELKTPNGNFVYSYDAIGHFKTLKELSVSQFKGDTELTAVDFYREAVRANAARK